MRADHVILGVGNLLMSDDGIGIHAARELVRNPPSGVLVVDAGTDYLSALPFLEGGRKALILDAVQGGDPPGSIYRLAAADIDCRPAIGSAHATSVLEARRFLPPGSPWPEITVLGVEPSILEYGLTLSEPVAGALPRLVAEARKIIREWRNESALNANNQVAS